MSVLLFYMPRTSLSPFLPTSFSSLTKVTTATPVSRLSFRPVDIYPKSNFNGIGFHDPILRIGRDAIIGNASSDVDGAAPTETPKGSIEEKAVAVEKLPLESKLQERAEQKLKMKLAKKIRLRRKRLVRKRRLRKKGRWPPSKMKKLKNEEFVGAHDRVRPLEM